MSGIEKSAALMIALGADTASMVLKYIDEDTAGRIAEEIVQLDNLSIEVRENIFNDFLDELKKNDGALFGGKNVATEILMTALSEKEAHKIIDKLTRRDIQEELDFLNTIDSKALTSLLENEHPQTITVALSYLNAEKAAAIVKNLPIFLSKDIIKRMAKLDSISPDIVFEVIQGLKKKYINYRESNNYYVTIDGINTLIDIMSQMKASEERQLLDYLDISDPALYYEIKEKIFSFDSIMKLSHQDTQILIDEIRNDHLISIALKGSDDEIRFKILRNMSLNRSTDIIVEMNNMGPIRMSEIDEARNHIVSVMRFLNDNGIISIKREKEHYVE